MTSPPRASPECSLLQEEGEVPTTIFYSRRNFTKLIFLSFFPLTNCRAEAQPLAKRSRDVRLASKVDRTPCCMTRLEFRGLASSLAMSLNLEHWPVRCTRRYAEVDSKRRSLVGHSFIHRFPYTHTHTHNTQTDVHTPHTTQRDIHTAKQSSMCLVCALYVHLCQRPRGCALV